MKILLIIPKYNNYGGEIKKIFQNQNVHVDVIEYDEYKLIKKSLFKIVTNKFLKVVSSKSGAINTPIFLRYDYGILNTFIRDSIKLLHHQNYDATLSVKLNGIADDVITKIISHSKKNILYLYDPIDTYPDVVNIFKSFNYVASYSKLDSEKYNIIHIPLIPDFSGLYTPNINIIYNSVFIGEFTFHRLIQLFKFPLGFLLSSKIIFISSPLGSFKINLGWLEFRGKRLSSAELGSYYSLCAAMLEIPNIHHTDNTPRQHDAKYMNKCLIASTTRGNISADLTGFEVRLFYKNHAKHEIKDFLSFLEIYKPLKSSQSVSGKKLSEDNLLFSETILKLIFL
jgi:hypothetical protein